MKMTECLIYYGANLYSIGCSMTLKKEANISVWDASLLRAETQDVNSIAIYKCLQNAEGQRMIQIISKCTFNMGFKNHNAIPEDILQIIADIATHKISKSMDNQTLNKSYQSKLTPFELFTKDICELFLQKHQTNPQFKHIQQMWNQANHIIKQKYYNLAQNSHTQFQIQGQKLNVKYNQKSKIELCQCNI